MEIRHLKMIQAVAVSGSLTRAAEQLFVSQSALSHQLKELEAEVNAQLFVRARKKMLLTPAGERLLETADRVLTELCRLQCDIDRLTRRDVGTLRLTTGCYTCYHWLSPVLNSFKTTYPKVVIEVIPEATYRAFEALLDGEVDLALVSNRLDNVHLHFYPLFEDELFAVVGPGHSWQERRHIYARDFERETLLMYDIPEPESAILNEFFKQAGTWPGHILRLKLTEAIVEMARAGMGAAILAGWAIRLYVERGDLIAIPLSKKFTRCWYAACLKNMEQPPFMQEFVRQLGAGLTSAELSESLYRLDDI